MWALTRRLNVERQPVQERVADQFREEQAQRKFDDAGYGERLHKPNGLFIATAAAIVVVDGRIAQDGRALIDANADLLKWNRQ
jgi:hypothetical protein